MKKIDVGGSIFEEPRIETIQDRFSYLLGCCADCIAEFWMNTG